MRIWSLHPHYLDRQGLVACWRESLLAQAVLAGKTRGYRNHPQLVRFRDSSDPHASIGAYLLGLADEATERGYHFDRTRIDEPHAEVSALTVTTGQIDHEWTHLLSKLSVRSPDRFAELQTVTDIAVHPLFTSVPGAICDWERV